jgi:carbamoyl-phosphate synthase large subunit
MITCVGGELMPLTIRSLKKIKGIKICIVGTDYNNNAVGKYFCDKFYKVPKGNSKNYISKCDQIVDKENINLIIPTSDEEALALSKKKEYFKKKNVTIACIDFETLNILNDKSKTYIKLSQLGITTAEWTKIIDKKHLVKQLKAYLNKYGGAVIKPLFDRGSRNIFIISKNKNKYNSNENLNTFSSVKEFMPILESKNLFKNYLIMQELFNPVVDVDLLSWQGKPISVIPRKRINPLNPNMGHKILDNKKLIKLGKQIIKGFHLSWLYDCDVMFDNNNNPIVIEINPRQSGSIAISIEAGFKIYENIIKLYLNKKTYPQSKIKKNIIIPYKGLLKI